MTVEEIIYREYPCLDPKHANYNEKLAFALKGNKAIVIDKKYGNFSGFGKVFYKFMEEEGKNGNHKFDLTKDKNMITNMSYIASPVKSESTEEF